MAAANTKTLDRRRFLQVSAAGLAAAGLAGLTIPGRARAAAPFKLPDLPYPQKALEPYISARTLSFHYGKHHAGYVKKLNRGVAGTPLAQMPLAQVIKKTLRNKAVFNNAAQAWNHTFYWQSMKPGGGGQPGADLMAKIKSDFGSYDEFKKRFSKQASGQFGSGWAWLVFREGNLLVMRTPNAMTPLAMGIKPLLTIDVWEHAYYLDYQNRRGDYIQAWLEHLVNWDFAASNFKA
ncbi:MAG: superoxide dismutase [Desulfarculaceae bacterium]